MKLTSLAHGVALVVLATALMVGPSIAKGLLGGAVQWAGRALGVKPVEDLGRNLDAEHRRFKENNPAYAHLERTATELLRSPFGLTCAATFETVIGSVRAACSRLASQSGTEPENLALAVAKDRLAKLGIVTHAELATTSIRWCQGDFLGMGITPAPNEILLNRALISRGTDDIAATIAHEVFHVRQFRSMGEIPFKCNYIQHYIACGGCQNKSHPMERDAYDFEALIADRLIATSDGGTTFDPNSRVMTFATSRGGITGVPTGPAERTDVPPVERPVSSNKELALRTCTVGGLPAPPAGCLSELDSMMARVEAAARQDKRDGTKRRGSNYAPVIETETESLCRMVSQDGRGSKSFPESRRFTACLAAVQFLADTHSEAILGK
jgi:hypothetical protein